ncbi:MAG: NUDIX hydrolase [Pseudomonadota bacterium]
MTFAVHHVAEVSLSVSPGPLAWEAGNAPAVAAHWQDRIAANPTLFNGGIFVCEDLDTSGTTLQATCRPMRYATLAYWRHLGQPDLGFWSIFGAVILRGTDGGLLVGRMARQNFTAGRVYFPGGLFDERDLSNDRLEANACILRECLEETGLAPPTISLAPGFLVYHDAHRVALTRRANLPGTATDAAAEITRWLATQDEPELAEIHPVYQPADLAKLDAEPYAQALAESIFTDGG